MAQRHYLEHIQETHHDGPVIFAGFNALNLCENRSSPIFKTPARLFFIGITICIMRQMNTTKRGNTSGKTCGFFLMS